MSLKISTERNFTVIKELNYKDQSLDPEKSRSADGNYMRVSVLNPVQISFRKGLHEYTDEDLQNRGEGDTIESILTWTTIKSFIKKGIIVVATGIVSGDELEEKEVKKTKKPVSFTTEG